MVVNSCPSRTWNMNDEGILVMKIDETTYFQKLLYPFGLGSIISILLSIISMNTFKMLERNGHE